MYNFYFTQLNSATLSRVCVAKWVLLFSTFFVSSPSYQNPKQGRVVISFLLSPPFGQPNANIFIHRFILYVLHTLASLVRAFQNTPLFDYNKPKLQFIRVFTASKLKKTANKIFG
jgi:hypothetical protein